MRHFGVFLNTNQYEALYVREICSCLSPILEIYNVPDSITADELEEQIKKEKVGVEKFGSGYHEHVLLERADWPDRYARFGFKLSYKTLIGSKAA